MKELKLLFFSDITHVDEDNLYHVMIKLKKAFTFYKNKNELKKKPSKYRKFISFAENVFMYLEIHFKTDYGVKYIIEQCDLRYWKR